jgi:hypothetical protein
LHFLSTNVWEELILNESRIPKCGHPFLLLGIKSVNSSTTCGIQLYWLRSIHIVRLFTKMTWQKKVTCEKDITCSTKRVTYCRIFHGIVKGHLCWGVLNQCCSNIVSQCGGEFSKYMCWVKVYWLQNFSKHGTM